MHSLLCKWLTFWQIRHRSGLISGGAPLKPGANLHTPHPVPFHCTASIPVMKYSGSSISLIEHSHFISPQQAQYLPVQHAAVTASLTHPYGRILFVIGDINSRLGAEAAVLGKFMLCEGSAACCAGKTKQLGDILGESVEQIPRIPVIRLHLE